MGPDRPVANPLVLASSSTTLSSMAGLRGGGFAQLEQARRDGGVRAPRVDLNASAIETACSTGKCICSIPALETQGGGCAVAVARSDFQLPSQVLAQPRDQVQADAAAAAI